MQLIGDIRRKRDRRDSFHVSFVPPELVLKGQKNGRVFLLLLRHHLYSTSYFLEYTL